MTTFVNESFELVTFGDIKKDGTPDITNVLFILPVPHNQMKIVQNARVDEIQIPGRSGKVKQAVGYEDSTININITLVDLEGPEGIVATSGGIEATADNQYAELQKAFRSRDEESLPKIFSIQSRLTDRCQIKTVLFKGLNVQDSPGSNDLAVIIDLIEFEPIAAQIDKQATRAKTAKAAAAEAKKAAGDVSGDLGGEEDPRAVAFRQGKADAMGGDYTGESPGDDPG